MNHYIIGDYVERDLVCARFLTQTQVTDLLGFVIPSFFYQLVSPIYAEPFLFFKKSV